MAIVGRWDRPMVTLVAAWLLAGCTADTPLNPSFPLRTNEARAELREMREDHVPAARPVVVIGGMLDVGASSSDLASSIRSHLNPEAPVLEVTLFATGSMDEARDRVLHAVESAWPSDDPGWTVEVDVIGFSLGGIIARHAAAEAGGDVRRLRIARLFTIASPHNGAKLAEFPTLDSRVVDLRQGSPLLARLAAAESRAGYETYAYVRLGDTVVGPERAGLNGTPPYWVENLPLDLAHANAHRDPRILADILRRLRGETPYSTSPSAPLPVRPYSSANSPEPVLTDP